MDVQMSNHFPYGAWLGSKFYVMNLATMFFLLGESNWLSGEIIVLTGEFYTISRWMAG